MDFDGTDDLAGSQFRGVNLRGARFADSDLSGVVIRGSELAHLEIDSPWLADSGNTVLVNGVDVVTFVEAELDRRSPGRADRRASDPAGLASAWAVLERTWAATVERAGRLPADAVEKSVAGEWSFSETLRHLVLATDAWLGRSILGLDQPFHPLGLIYAGVADEGIDVSVFATTQPTYGEVLAVRAQRQAMVREFIATVTAAELRTIRSSPWESYPQTTLSCLRVILDEEWEHHRYAVRDLDLIESGAAT